MAVTMLCGVGPREKQQHSCQLDSFLELAERLYNSWDIGPSSTSGHFKSQRVVHGCHHAHDRGHRARIVLYQATNGVHEHIDHMIDVREHDQLKTGAAPTANTEHGAQSIQCYMGFPWSLILSIQCQPFHCATQKRYPALIPIPRRLP